LNSHGLQRQVTVDNAVSPQALGADQDLRGELRRLALPSDTRLVLTSDGFEAGLRRRSKKSASAEPVAVASSIAATLLRDGASAPEIAQRLGTLAAASSPDDVTVVTVG
jgi:hypothetical protein